MTSQTAAKVRDALHRSSGLAVVFYFVFSRRCVRISVVTLEGGVLSHTVWERDRERETGCYVCIAAAQLSVSNMMACFLILNSVGKNVMTPHLPPPIHKY